MVISSLPSLEVLVTCDGTFGGLHCARAGRQRRAVRAYEVLRTGSRSERQRAAWRVGCEQHAARPGETFDVQLCGDLKYKHGRAPVRKMSAALIVDREHVDRQDVSRLTHAGGKS